MDPNIPMERRLKLWCITVATLTILNGTPTRSNPYSSAPAPTSDCSVLIYDMLDCTSFLQNDASDPKPSASCCSGFETILQTDAKCICEGLKDAANMGISINISKAALLPSLCHVSAPPISSCNVSIAPSPGSSSAPSTSSPPIPAAPTNPPTSPIPATPPSIPVILPPSIPTTSPSPSAEANSPNPPKSTASSTMPFLVSYIIMVVGSFLV